MRLAPRFALAFGALAVVSTGLAGIGARQRLAARETARFDAELRDGCARVVREVERQAEADRRLVGGACASGELVDRLLVALEAGDLDDRRLAFSTLVGSTREAFDVEELALLARGGHVVGAEPKALLRLSPAAVDAELAAPPAGFVLREGAPRALVTRCVRRGARGDVVGLVAARHVDPLAARVGTALGLQVSTAPGAGAAPPEGMAEARCALRDPGGHTLPLAVRRSRAPLEASLLEVTGTVLASSLAALALAFALAVAVARRVSRPLAELAEQADRVGKGDARPLGRAGDDEIGQLGAAFDRMLGDLEATRRRLAAASRVAAWREVARRVAHEVKNPLAPIRAAVETLRRLRAREDPAFDEYFDEATRTVLEEVHRIAGIVTEFTRFARLPPPRPSPVDLDELARSVVTLQRAAAGATSVEVVASPAPPVNADRDQIVQVLTNLVGNALEATGKAGGRVRVEIAPAPASPAGPAVSVTVADDGPGVAPDMVPRLFEPYATDKAQGTGLGLAIAQRIALEHGGELAHLGAGLGGRGARFRLTLTVAGPDPEGPASAARDGAAPVA